MKIVLLRDNTMTDSDMELFSFLEDGKNEVKVLIDRPYIKDASEFTQQFRIMEEQGPDAIPVNEELKREMKDAELVITMLSPIASECIRSAEKLQTICILRSGVENVNLQVASECGVRVVNCPGRLSIPVSEFTVGMIIAEMKNIARAHASTHDRREFEHDFPNFGKNFNINGKTVGLVGCGMIGKRVAHIMEAFGAHIMIYDPYAKKESLEKQGYQVVDLDTLCAQADVISVHFRLTSETVHLIGKEQIAKMKNTAYVINTARADLIDEDALVEALKEHRIAGAALDVYHQEPLPENSPFYELDNVTMTPHFASNCPNLVELTVNIFRENLEQVKNGGEWKFVVNKI